MSAVRRVSTLSGKAWNKSKSQSCMFMKMVLSLEGEVLVGMVRVEELHDC